MNDMEKNEKVIREEAIIYAMLKQLFPDDEKIILEGVDFIAKKLKIMKNNT